MKTKKEKPTTKNFMTRFTHLFTTNIASNLLLCFDVFRFLNIEQKFDFTKVVSFQKYTPALVSCCFYFMQIEQFSSLMGTNPIHFTKLVLNKELFNEFIQQDYKKIKKFIQNLRDDHLKLLVIYRIRRVYN